MRIAGCCGGSRYEPSARPPEGGLAPAWREGAQRQGCPPMSPTSGTVMITTGGTGGHVFPGLAVAAKLIARGCRVFWLGTREGMEAKLVPQHGVDFESLSFRG